MRHTISMPETRQYDGFKAERGETSAVIFNNPGVNVFSTPTLNAFIKFLDELKGSGVRALVVTGEGPTFMAGADIKEMSAFGVEEARAFSALFHRAMNAAERFPAPVISAVNGFALGGGTELVLASDIVIASESAVFGQPELSLGIIPGAGGTQRLARRVGALMAKELIFTGRRVGADEALAIGLVNRVVPKDRLMEEAVELARAVASKPARCVEAAKRLIDSGSLEAETEEFCKLFSDKEPGRLMEEFLKKKR